MCYERKFLFFCVCALVCSFLFVLITQHANLPPYRQHVNAAPSYTLVFPSSSGGHGNSTSSFTSSGGRAAPVVSAASTGSSSFSSWSPPPTSNDALTSDYSRLIDLTNFEFLINTPCTASPPLSLYVVLVHSAVQNFEKRRLIRNTWGAKVAVYFFLGQIDSPPPPPPSSSSSRSSSSPSEETLLAAATNQSKVEQESAEFGDIVQGNFYDSYRNLTYKHAMVFKWSVYYCRDVKYILKVDDDTFVNVPKLERFFVHSLSRFGARNLLMCVKIMYRRVERTFRSKWRVSFSEYEKRYYPPYCFGFAILYSPDMIYKLYVLLQTGEKFFWIDDVFVTGIVFAQLNMTQGVFADVDKHHHVSSDSDPWTLNGVSSSVVSSSSSRKRTSTDSYCLVLDDWTVYNPVDDLFAIIYEPNFASKYEYLYNVTFLLPQTSATSGGSCVGAGARTPGRCSFVSSCWWPLYFLVVLHCFLLER